MTDCRNINKLYAWERRLCTTTRHTCPHLAVEGREVVHVVQRGHQQEHVSGRTVDEAAAVGVNRCLQRGDVVLRVQAKRVLNEHILARTRLGGRRSTVSHENVGNFT